MQISKLVLSIAIAAAATAGTTAHAKTSTSCTNQRGVAMFDKTNEKKAPVGTAKKIAPPSKEKTKR